MKQINLKQVNWMKALKIAGGGVAAILLAEALGLQNAASAGIITLLTVQNTRRETVMSSVRRFAGFGIMTLLSLPIYHFCGTAPWSFGIVLLLLLLLCYAFRMDDATPINAVMATHYMFAGGVSIGMVGNEILLLVIGSGIGVCLNWFMPRNLKKSASWTKKSGASWNGCPCACWRRTILAMMTAALHGQNDCLRNYAGKLTCFCRTRPGRTIFTLCATLPCAGNSAGYCK